MLLISAAKTLGWFLLVAIPCVLLMWRGARKLVVPMCLLAGSAEAGQAAPGPGDAGGEAVRARPIVAIGFTRSAGLRAALRARIAQAGRYEILESAEIPAADGAIFVGGHGVRVWQEAGQVSCEARYLLLRQPEHQVLGWGKPRASAGGEGACLESLAALLWAEAEALLRQTETP